MRSYYLTGQPPVHLLADAAVRGATGTALVPAIVVGSDLAVFPLGLFGMYLNRPGLPDMWNPAGSPMRGEHQ
jgi:hypothetical protein